MEKSQSIKHLASALMDFQSRIEKIKKDSDNPFFKSKYASLSTILDTIQVPLAESGLAFSQLPTDNGGLTTLLIHADSGEFIQSTYFMSPVKNDPQGIGSCITYQRRYALSAVLGLNIDEDDDGNKASMADPKKTEKPKIWLNPNTPQWTEAVKYLQGNGSMDKIRAKYLISKENEEKLKNAVLEAA